MLAPTCIGARHDLFMLNESKIIEILREKFPEFVINGDPAYPLLDVLLKGLTGLSEELHVQHERKENFTTVTSVNTHSNTSL